ncbi:DSBA-like thioredoxin domain-containing protein [Lipomyces oligophaga]|uniref:DSBA-like thioredoxin domain-containing protein n=1 Tax=Lipomyces oligophaga TaxID=45792 RepID=UPI0034CE2CF3
MTVIPINIVSDAVCPWCYVGYAALQRAMSTIATRHPGTTFDIKWHAFELNRWPADKPVMSKAQAYKEKFGDGPRLKMMQDYLKQRGAQVGVKMGDSADAVIGSTRYAHEAEVYATQKGKQTEFMLALFDEYFTKNKNIFEIEKLVELAGKVDGLDPSELRDFLAKRQGAGRVEAEIQKNQFIGGVPHYTIGDGIVLHGSQDPEAFVSALEECV